MYIIYYNWDLFQSGFPGHRPPGRTVFQPHTARVRGPAVFRDLQSHGRHVQRPGPARHTRLARELAYDTSGGLVPVTQVADHGGAGYQ